MDIEMKLKKLEEMEQNLPNYQSQMENLKAFDENVELLCQRGFLKKEANGTFAAVESMEE